jgi:hypothetical protein
MLQKQQATKVIVVVPRTAAGTTNVNGTAIDMSLWESVEFIAVVDTLTATQVTKLKAQASSDNAATDDFGDLEGTSITFPDNANNKAGRLEVVRPQKKWIRPVVVRGTENAAISCVIAILSNPRNQPITQDASVAANESHVSPAEGTA